MPNLHTNTNALINGSFGVVKFCSLRGEGRRGAGKVDLRMEWEWNIWLH